MSSVSDELAIAKRTEKLQKKAKLFLDEKQKTKVRLGSLTNFLEAATGSFTGPIATSPLSLTIGLDTSTSNEVLLDQQITLKFLSENYVQAFSVLQESFYQQADKLKGKDKVEKVSGSSKDVAEIVKITVIIRKLLCVIPDKLEDGYESSGIYKMVHMLLLVDNSQKLRVEGIRLLLVLINNQANRLMKVNHPSVAATLKQIIDEYLLSINLEKLECSPYPRPIELAKSDCLDDDYSVDIQFKEETEFEKFLRRMDPPENFCTESSVIQPNFTQTSEADSLEIFDEIVSNIQHLAVLSCLPSITSLSGQSAYPMCPSPYLGSAKSPSPTNRNFTNMKLGSISEEIFRYTMNHGALTALLMQWSIFKTCVLARIFRPTLRKKSDLENSSSFTGNSLGPIEILRSFLAFICRIYSDDPTPFNQTESAYISQYSTPEDFAQRVCHTLRCLFFEIEGREIVIEAIRQALMVPWCHSEICRSALYLMKLWAVGKVDERESTFLLEPQASENIPEEVYLRRYIRFVKLLYLDKKDYVEFVGPQIVLWKEGIQLVRILACIRGPSISPASWECLLSTLTDIIQHTLCRPNKYAGVSSPQEAEEFCDIALETLFGVFIRSGNTSERFWTMAHNTLIKCARWNQMTSQYVAAVHKLTKALNIRVFGIDDASLVKHDLDTKTSQRLRTASIMASKIRSGAPSFSSQNSAHSAKIFNSANDRRDLSVDDLTSSAHNARELKSIQSNDSIDSQVHNPSQYQKKQFERKIEVSALATTKEPKSANSSLGSLLSGDGSNERLADKTAMAPALFKIPPLSSNVIAAIEDFTDFVSLSSMWLPDWTFCLWKTVICSIGNINEILTSPSQHVEIIRCLVQICDILDKVRNIQPYDGVVMPPLFEFAPWIFKSCEMPSDYHESRIIAFGCMCRIMCKRHDQVLPDGCVSQFYRILLKGLDSDDTRILSSILTNCTSIFTVLLPGSSILIPAFMRAIKLIWSSKFSKDENLIKTKESTVKILSSLLWTPNWKRGLLQKNENLPELRKKVDSIDSVAENDALDGKNDHLQKYPFLDGSVIRRQVLDIILDALKEETCSLGSKNEGDTHVALIWAFVTCCFHHLGNNDEPPEVHPMSLSCILESLNSLKTRPAIACAEGVGLLAQECSTLDFSSLDLKHTIFRLTESCSEHSSSIGAIRQNREPVAVRIVSAITHWIMNTNHDLLADPSVGLSIFEAFEHLLKQTEADSDADLSKISKRESSYFGSNGRLTGSGSEKGNQDAVDESDEWIKQFVENSVSHILHHYNNFAPPFGPVILDSVAYNLEEKRTQLHLGANDSSVLTIIETNGDPDKLMVKASVRNTTGRFNWECKSLTYDSRTTTLGVNPVLISPDLITDLSPTPTHSENHEERQEDALSSILKVICEVNNDCNEDWKLKTKQTDEKLLAASQMRVSIQEQIVSEEKSTVTYFNDRSSESNPSVLSSECKYDKLAGARIWLSQLGHFNYDNLKEGYMFPLSHTPALNRDIKGLDRKVGRDVVKIALIYVAPGHEDETSILTSHESSLEYAEFVSSLGWEIDVSTHSGYLGGLEKSQASGSKAIYYCDHSVEVIFHDITKMPTDTADPKQVKKKRHIGNDHVHIVWNEHCRDYRKNTIGGDFGNVVIVVTPLNGVYTIQVLQDQKISSFGPLQHCTSVSKSCLGPLVRRTAVNAYYRSISMGIFERSVNHPYSQRLNDIATILTRHKSPKFNFEAYLSSFFNA